MKKGHALVQLLAQRQAHEGIAKVYDQLGQGHFHKAAAGGHQVKPGHLPRAGDVQQGDQQGLPGVEAYSCRLDTKGKGYRQVSQGNGQAM